jgi:hypothetical protein
VDASQEQVLTAVIDRIIPADDFPSASQAGVMNFLHRTLAGDAAMFAPVLAEGLADLERATREATSMSFVDLDPAAQDKLLTAIGDTPFFRRLTEMTNEGYYADPGNGGNLNAISWTMIGYKGEPS